MGSSLVVLPIFWRFLSKMYRIGAMLHSGKHGESHLSHRQQTDMAIEETVKKNLAIRKRSRQAFRR